MVESEKTPHGYIYRATNKENGKIYIGQTGTDHWGRDKVPIEERWKDEIREAYAKKKRGEKLRYIENAIIKYSEERFDLKQQDVAYNQKELNSKERQWIKDYDSVNPDKGYNMTEGGFGGRPSPELRDYLSKVGREKWRNDPAYRERQTQERRERAKNPEWVEKMTKINQEKGKDPKFQEKVSKAIYNKWDKDPEYRKKQENERKERAKNPEFREKMRKINQEKGKDPKFQEKVRTAITNKYQNDPVYRERQTQERRERAKNPEWVEKMTKINQERAKDPEWREKMREIGKQYRKEISDKQQFLEDIQNMQKKDINEKYNMDGKTVNRRIKEMLGENGVNNYTEAKDYLQDKDINDVLKDIAKKEEENQGENSENKPDEKDSEGEKPRSEEKDKESVEESQEEEVDEIREKPEEEAKDEKEKITPEAQIAEPKDSPEETSTEEPDNQQQTQIEEPSDNQSNKSLEKSSIGNSFEPILIPEPDGKKTKEEKNYDDMNGLIRDPGPHAFIDNRFALKPPKDYSGVDRSTPVGFIDNWGIPDNINIPDKDYNGLDEDVQEKGNDFDGIDSPLEGGDKDFDNIDDDGDSEGRGESGGES